MINRPIIFGKRAASLIGAKWNNERHIVQIVYIDDCGVEYQTEALGMSEKEIREAIVNDLMISQIK